MSCSFADNWRTAAGPDSFISGGAGRQGLRGVAHPVGGGPCGGKATDSIRQIPRDPNRDGDVSDY